MCNYMLTFLRNFHHLTFSPALYESSSCSAPFLVLSIICLFIFSHWLVYSGVSLGFNLHFPEDSRCWVPLHMLIGHWCIFVCDVFLQIFCPFKICLPLLDCKVVFLKNKNLDTSALSVICFFLFFFNFILFLNFT